MAQVLHRTQRSSIGSMPNFNPAIHVRKLDARAAAPQLATQVMADESVMIHVQPKVVVDSTRNRAGFDYGRGFGKPILGAGILHGVHLDLVAVPAGNVNRSINVVELHPAICGKSISLVKFFSDRAAMIGGVSSES